MARLARIDPELLCPVKHRSPQAQADLTLIRARAALVRARTALVNTARSLAKSYGERLRRCNVVDHRPDLFAPGVSDSEVSQRGSQRGVPSRITRSFGVERFDYGRPADACRGDGTGSYPERFEELFKRVNASLR